MDRLIYLSMSGAKASLQQSAALRANRASRLRDSHVSLARLSRVPPAMLPNRSKASLAASRAARWKLTATLPRRAHKATTPVRPVARRHNLLAVRRLARKRRCFRPRALAAVKLC